MATKTISLELDAYEKLRAAKREGESFSEVVRRAHFDAEESSGANILSQLAKLPVIAADLEASSYWERQRARTISPSKWATK